MSFQPVPIQTPLYNDRETSLKQISPVWVLWFNKVVDFISNTLVFENTITNILLLTYSGGLSDTVFGEYDHIDGGFSAGSLKVIDCTLGDVTEVLPFRQIATFIKDDTSANTVSFAPPDPSITVKRLPLFADALVAQDDVMTFERSGSNLYKVA